MEKVGVNKIFRGGVDLINIYCWRINGNGGAWQDEELGRKMSLAGTETGGGRPWLHSPRRGLQEVAVNDAGYQGAEGAGLGAAGEHWPGSWEGD